MQEHPAERRNFHRIIFRQPVVLLSEPERAAQLLDISLKGALLEVSDWNPTPKTQVRAQVSLTEDQQVTIEFQARVAHCENQHIGLEISSMDLSSATALRRLVELNLGDPALLERDLEHLLPELS